jgi:hypothetical protein
LPEFGGFLDHLMFWCPDFILLVEWKFVCIEIKNLALFVGVEFFKLLWFDSDRLRFSKKTNDLLVVGHEKSYIGN